MEQKKEKTILRVINIIILIIILILLFLLIKKFNYNSLKSTGNVDIFNIECNSDDNDCNNKIDNNPGDITDVFNDDEKLNSEVNYSMDNFYVMDSGKIWNSENELKIFSNAAYEFESIIAPGSSNAYHFIVNNNNRFNIEYSISLIETNEQSINMKYKLKRNGEYIFGSSNSWVNATDIQKEGLPLNARFHDTYELEWKWVDNDNDTDVAFNEANYLLKIEINAKSV